MFKNFFTKKIMRNLKIFIIVIIGTFIGFLSSTSLSQIKIKQLEVDENLGKIDDNDPEYANGRFLAEIILRVKKDYVDEKDDKYIHQAAASGLLSSLDPHSSYLNQENLQEMQTQTKGEFGGLGIEITSEMSAVKVVAALEGTPAQEAGIKTGDFIIKVDDENIVGLSLTDAVKKMRGKPGTKAKITLLRQGEREPLEKIIRREIIKVDAVKSALFNDVLYVKINTFSQQAYSGLEKEINKLKEKLGDIKPRGLVLDLRNNPGGLLDEAIKISDAFLDKGKMIVSIKGRSKDSKKEYFDENDESLLKDLPIALLINEGSASASEIVAGALQDNNRAIIMGKKSFGKGSVQTVIPLKEGRLGAIRLTTSLYYTPSGKSIQAHGIEPNIEIETAKLEIQDNKNVSSESELNGHIEVKLKEALLESKKDKNIEDDNIKIYNEDYQLARAIDLIRGVSVYNASLNKKVLIP